MTHSKKGDLAKEAEVMFGPMEREREIKPQCGYYNSMISAYSKRLTKD
jgi:hypothetical protein